MLSLCHKHRVVVVVDVVFDSVLVVSEDQDQVSSEHHSQVEPAQGIRAGTESVIGQVPKNLDLRGIILVQGFGAFPLREKSWLDVDFAESPTRGIVNSDAQALVLDLGPLRRGSLDIRHQILERDIVVKRGEQIGVLDGEQFHGSAHGGGGFLVAPEILELRSFFFCDFFAYEL